MIAFSIFWHPIYRYGIFYLIAFILWYLGCRYIAKKKYFAKKFPWVQMVLDTRLEELLIFIFLGVLIGGRLGHVLIYDLSYFIAHPAEIIAVRKGGMSFIGGIFGVALAVMIFRKRRKGKASDLLLIFDTLILVVPLGIALGRLGNYLNQELYGIIVSSNFPLALKTFFTQINLFHVYPSIDNALRINTNFLSIFFEWITIFVIGLFVFRRQLRHQKFTPGKMSVVFLMLYSFTRFRLEYVRADSQMEFVWRFTKSQWFFIGFFVLGLILLLIIRKLRK